VHRFLFDATPPGDPGAGRISIENVGGQDRLIRVSKTDADGGTVALALLAVNDSVALASTEPAPTIYARGYASTVATDAVTHWEFTAVRESGAGALPADGTPLNLAITMAHGGGGGGAGLKVYATLAEVEAVKTAEVGILHVENMAAAFPNLAVVGTGVEKFFGTGPADLVITTTMADSTFASPPDVRVYHQEFTVGHGVPFATTVAGESVTIERVIATKPGMNESGYLWYPRPRFPVTSYIGDMMIAEQVSGLPGLWWNLIHTSENAQASTVMVRNSAGNSKVNPPTYPDDITNKEYVDAAIADFTTLHTGHGAPAEDVGEAGNFYIDLDTGTMYGPKRADLYQSEPPILAGVPESFPAVNTYAGVRFTVDVPGRVSGLRLYQWPATIGNYNSASLYDAAGTKLTNASEEILVTEQFVELPFNPAVAVAPGQEYVVAVPLYTTASYNAVGAFPMAGESVTLLGAMTGPVDLTIPDVPDAGDYWIEPVFQVPVTTLWPVAIQGGGGGGMKVYADMAEVGTLTQSEVGILSVPDMAAAFPIMAVKEPSAFKAFPGSVVIHTTVTGDSATKNLVNQRIEVGDYWGPTVLAERTWMQNVVDPVPYNGGWYPGGVLPRPDDGTTMFAAGVRTAGQYEQVPMQSEYAGKNTLVYRDATTGMAKILGPATDPQHIVNKQYVDDAVAGAGGGLTVYPDLAAVDAVRTGDVGVLHVDDLALAFPALAALNPVFAGHGPADLVIETSITDYQTDVAPNDFLTYGVQTFSVSDQAWGAPVRVYRAMSFQREGGDATAPYFQAWAIEAKPLVMPPGTGATGDLYVRSSPSGTALKRIAAPTADRQVLTADLIQSAKMRWAQPTQAPWSVQEWGGTVTVDVNYEGKLYMLNGAGPLVVTLPSTGATVGVQTMFVQNADGPVTFVAGAGAILKAPGGKTKLAGQYSKATVTKLNYEQWLIEGDLVVP
jgi:hypothetical protein